MKIITLVVFAFLSTCSLSQNQLNFFDSADNFFETYCSEGYVNYSDVKSDTTLPKLIDYIENNEYPSGNEKAYLINVYNLFVINKISGKFPMRSPMDESDFFTDKTFLLNGKKMSLDYLENSILRKDYADPRLHFVLVCGAIGCPPIVDFAYRTDQLDSQLDTQAKKSLNNDAFVYSKEKTIYLSEIFNWYQSDFGKNNKEVIAYINGFRKVAFDEAFRVQYYPYDWTLNNNYRAEIMKSMKDARNVALVDNPIHTVTMDLQLFTAGSLLFKGQSDITLFNTMYTENKQNWKGSGISGYRATFVTHLFQYTYGISKSRRINIGLDLSFRSTGASTDSTLGGITPAFSYKNTDTSRVGLTSAGIRLKVQPFKNVNDFSIQTTFILPTIKHPEGYYPSDPSEQTLSWADWDRITWWNQIFYTKSFGKFQLFTELDLLFRFKKNANQIGMLDLPVSAFLSYFPTKKITVYAMTQHVHRYTNPIEPQNPEITDWVIGSNYTASGLGLKYQLLSNLNLEFLYTNFWRGRNSGLGNTFNIGIKFLTK